MENRKERREVCEPISHCRSFKFLLCSHFVSRRFPCPGTRMRELVHQLRFVECTGTRVSIDRLWRDQRSTETAASKQKKESAFSFFFENRKSIRWIKVLGKNETWRFSYFFFFLPLLGFSLSPRRRFNDTRAQRTASSASVPVHFRYDRSVRDRRGFSWVLFQRGKSYDDECVVVHCGLRDRRREKWVTATRVTATRLLPCCAMDDGKPSGILPLFEFTSEYKSTMRTIRMGYLYRVREWTYLNDASSVVETNARTYPNDTED